MSSNNKLLVVLGITGQQGGSVAKVFSDLEPTWRIRGITRNPSSPASQSLLKENPSIELVSGNLDDQASLEAAFKDADAIFSVTDFWSQFKSSGTYSFESDGDTPINIQAYNSELKQGKNIIDAAALAHAKKPLHRFILSTLSDTKKFSNGTITENYHFDSKAQYTNYLNTHHPDLASVSSYLQIGWYLSNIWAWPIWTPHKKYPSDPSSNVYIYPTTHVSSKTSHPIPFVHPPNDTGHFVHALLLKSPPGTNMLGYSWLASQEDFAKLWGKVLGVEIEIESMSLEKIVKSGMPEWLAREVLASGEYCDTFGWDGGEEGVKSPEEAGVEVSRLQSVEEWIRGEDWSSIGIGKKD
ncbi:NmrA-like family domain-containing protein 1 [Pseudocercospora fuligena]|uniref:NmrA-like family domain-containing protein 1 n=1 Tax=Pseudocercospora fuligena TaxID=685502 RepID=A0A8H6RE32_9PEZI|nr:NmrA-like family domain-containing protein 1 [Pseudocercospora fuligena]